MGQNNTKPSPVKGKNAKGQLKGTDKPKRTKS